MRARGSDLEVKKDTFATCSCRCSPGSGEHHPRCHHWCVGDVQTLLQSPIQIGNLQNLRVINKSGTEKSIKMIIIIV